MDSLNVIISGVEVFIIGEIFVRFFLAPIHKFKEIKGEIASILLFHANNYGHEYKNLADVLGTTGGDERVISERILESTEFSAILTLPDVGHNDH
jgi:hypothetical protein